MHLKSSRHLLLLTCGALLAALAGPASAQNICARLTDSTGTLVEITDLGTIGRFLCHGIPFLDGQIQGFALCTGGVTGAASVTAAAATGAGGATVTKGVSPVSCFGPFTLEFNPTTPMLPIVTSLVPDPETINTFTIPLGTTVIVRTLTKGSAGLGVETHFTFTGGNCQICVRRKIFTTGGAKTLAAIKEIAAFAPGTLDGDFSVLPEELTSFGIEGDNLAVKLVNPERFGGAVILRGTGNTRASRNSRRPSEAFAFDSADLEAEFGSCVPSASGTRDVTTGAQVAELFLNFRDDKNAGAVKLTSVAQSGSEVFYSFCINAD
jgi:hypothetical protein